MGHSSIGIIASAAEEACVVQGLAGFGVGSSGEVGHTPVHATRATS
jgi:hypothetical protein